MYEVLVSGMHHTCIQVDGKVFKLAHISESSEME